MFQLSSRPLRTLMIAAALAGGAATTATPALAAKTPHAKAAKTTKAKGATKTKGKKSADLVVRGFEFEVLSASIAVDAELANIGNGRANRSTTTIALSSDAVLSGSDQVLGTASTNRIKSSTATGVTAEVEIPETLPEGDLYLLVCADGGNAVKERVESNNCAAELLASADEEVSEDDEGYGDDDDTDTVEVEDGE